MQVVLLGHGSRDPRHAETIEAIAARLHLRHDAVHPRAAYLDLCRPTLAESVADLPGQEVTVVPMLLTSANHARIDVPAAVAAARTARPDLTIRTTAVLGPSASLQAALEVRAQATGLNPDADRTAVLLVGAGSSDDDARAQVGQVAARWLAAPRRGAYAFAAGPGPAVTDSVRRLADEGIEHILLAPYLLAPGLLPDRAFTAARATADELGLDLRVAEVLGSAAGVLDVIAERIGVVTS